MVVDRMTGEVLTLVIAIAAPIVGLAAVVGLLRGVTDLERSRDELAELRGSGR